MGQLPPSAFLCQHPTNQGQPLCGYANVCCPGAARRDAGLPAEMPICSGSQLAMRGENDALTPGPCQSEGVTGG